MRYKFKKKGHINVLECRVHKTWLKHCARKYPNSRVLALLDSRVTLGSTSKGRSSSKAICRVLQGSLGYILGGGLYPGGLHICSAKNRSDGPSRNKRVPPTAKEFPPWLLALRKEHYTPFDLVLIASRVTKLEARWMRLLLLGGDIEPNPGPTRRHAIPRGPLDMTVGFAPQTSGRMQSCVVAFEGVADNFAIFGVGRGCCTVSSSCLWRDPVFFWSSSLPIRLHHHWTARLVSSS